MTTRRLILAGLALLALSGAAHAAPSGFCQAYAQTAVQQYWIMRKTPGCARPPSNLWHTQPSRHFNWCLSAPVGAVKNQTWQRNMAISACDPGYGD